MNKLLPLLLLFATLFACKSQKETTSPSRKLTPLKPKSLYKKVMKQQKHYESFSARAKMKYDDGDNSQSVTAGLRYQKDSAFLAMLSATFGIEVARIKIADDTVRIIDRMNKKYIEKSFDQYGNILPFPLQLKLVEDVILGNTFVGSKKDISASVDKGFHVLTVNGTSLTTTIWVNPDQWTKHRMQVQDKASGRNLKVRYSDYQKKKGQWFPFEQEIRFTGGKQLQIDLNIKRLTLNDEVRFPFTVADKYKQKN